MIRIAICDDDKTFAGEVESRIIKLADVMCLRVETDVYFDGAALLEGIRNGDRYELIFLDIEMKQINGIDAARQIRELNQSVLLIYASAHEQYLKELFEVEPFRFLSKPLNEKLFQRYFQEAIVRIEESNAYFQYKNHKVMRKVPFQDILYFESDYRMVNIHLRDGKQEQFYAKLSDVEKEVKETNQCFIRIHQSYLVNYHNIKKMDFVHVTLSAREGKELELKISEDRQKEVRKKLCALMGEMTDTKGI